MAELEPRQEEQAQQPFDYSMLRGVPTGYTPLPTNVPGEPEGSLWKANFRQETSIGSFINSSASNVLNNEVDKNLDFVDRVPRDLFNYADRFVACRTDEDFRQVESQIRQELGDKALISAHPWKSFGIGLIQQPFDPVNWLPMGALYKNVKRGSQLTRAIIGSGATTALATTAQEAILQRNELTREGEESVANIITSGIIGGALGALGTGINVHLNKRDRALFESRQRATNEVRDIITEKDKELDANGLLKDNDLIGLPAFVRKAMNITPMNRLLNSKFDTAKYFGGVMYEHNYTKQRHIAGEADGASLETLIRLDMGIDRRLMTDYQDIYFNMVGIPKGPFRGTRTKLKNPDMTIDEFDSAVWSVLSTQEPNPREHVNQAADLLKTKLFDPSTKKLIELGRLTEDVTPKNAAGYIMSVYNKQKIIEEGGKYARGAGTITETLFQDFKATQEQIKQFKQSPLYQLNTQRINTNKELLKGLPATERLEIDKKINKFNKQIKTLETKKLSRPKNEMKSINESISKITKEIKSLNESIANKQKTYQAQINNEVQSFKNELTNTQKKISPLNNEIQKLQTKIKELRERRIALKERIKSAKPESKTYKKLQEELDTLPSAITEVEKNISDIKSEKNTVQSAIANIKKDINRLQSLAKLEAEGIPELKERIKNKEKEIDKLNQTKKPSPEEIKNLDKEIKELEAKAKKLEESKKPSKKEQQRLSKEIEELESQVRDATPARLLNSEGNLRPIVSDDVLWKQVEQTVDHILADNDGAMLNPILSKIKGTSTKPFKERKMSTEQSLLKDWHVTNMSTLMQMYSRAIRPVIRMTEFAQRHGAKDIQEMRERFSEMIMAEYNEKAKGLSGKEAAELRKTRDSNLQDMRDTIDLLMGVYGDGPNILNNSAREYYQNFLKWNYVRLLGYMTISSIADAGAQVFVHGPYRFIHDGLVQTFSEARKISKTDLRAIAYGIETELGSRLKSYAEHQGLSTNPSPFTRGLDALTQGFGNLSMMNQWNSWQQTMAGHIGINRTLETIHKVMEGKKVSKKETERLARIGLDQKHWETIYNFTKDNRDSSGAYFADWTNWDIKTKEEAQALEQFQASVAKEIDSIVIVPGLGDKPLFAQKPLGKLLFQFKSFLMASTNRLLYSGFQRKNDINMYLGVISMLGMGAMSYVATSLIRGNEPDLSFGNLSHEAVDKSGLLGIWGEVGNVALKTFGIGVTSRYQSRDVMGSLFGPSTGAISELATILNKIRYAATGEDDITTKDAEKLLRLFPLQNLFYLHQLNKKLVKDTAISLGATDAG